MLVLTRMRNNRRYSLPITAITSTTDASNVVIAPEMIEIPTESKACLILAHLVLLLLST